MSVESKTASLFTRGDKIFVQPNFRTTAGLYLGGEPVTVLSAMVTSVELGTAVLKSLSQYRSNFPHPKRPSDFNSLPDHLLTAAGIKRWSTFSKGALRCLISSSSTELTIMPSYRASLDGSYLEITESEVRLTLPASYEVVGDAVREALSRCQ